MRYIVIIFIVALALAYFNAKKAGAKKPSRAQPSYQYRKKSFFMTKAEHAFYTQLDSLYGERYFIFPQVHLSEFLDHTVTGQDWRAALGAIQRKSVDYVICDKAYVRPLVAIELDDHTHERADRVKRDNLVESICAQAGMPLVRFTSTSTSADDIQKKMSNVLIR
jgi:hypothetical protein